MKYIEKEIKFEIKDLPKLIDCLKKNGAKFLNESKERTIRLDTSDGALEKKGVFLRVRAGSKNTITLKEKVGDDRDVRARKETEFEIKDVDAMAYILERLGFDYLRIMEKYRINLEYKGTKLSIDELSIGFYLEIEGPEKKIEAVAEELGFDLKEKILVTYWDILEEFNKRNKTKRKDIVFPKEYQPKLLGAY